MSAGLADANLASMRESTIAKQRSAGPESDFARALGAELRKERVARGLTQAHLGYPLTRRPKRRFARDSAAGMRKAVAHVGTG